MARSYSTNGSHFTIIQTNNKQLGIGLITATRRARMLETASVCSAFLVLMMVLVIIGFCCWTRQHQNKKLKQMSLEENGGCHATAGMMAATTTRTTTTATAEENGTDSVDGATRIDATALVESMALNGRSSAVAEANGSESAAPPRRIFQPQCIISLSDALSSSSSSRNSR